MIELEIGKAFVAVEYKKPDDGLEMPLRRCINCYFYVNGKRTCWISDEMRKLFSCSSVDRKDGKSVIFKIVDFNSHYIDGTMRGKQ